MSSLPLYTGMYDPDTAGFLGGPRRVEAYKPAHRGALLTWNSSRDAATTRIESYRVSNGNLGCPWPVDVRPGLEKEREALRSRLGTAEGRMRDIEGMLASDNARAAVTHTQLQAISDLATDPWQNIPSERSESLKALRDEIKEDFFPQGARAGIEA